MKFILHAGVLPELPDFLKDKIKITNQVALMMAGVGLAYTVFSMVYYPKLTVYPVFCIVFSFGAIGLNAMGFYNVSRLLLSTLLLLLAFLYHAFLVQPGETIINAMYTIEFSLTVIPWVLVDFRERKLLIACLTICYLIFFLQPWANEYFTMQVDSAMFRSGWLSIASFAFGVVILILCLLFMQHKNHLSETQNEELMQNIQHKNEEMANQRKELEDNLEEMKEARKEEEKLNWITNGLARVADILRQDDEDVYLSVLQDIIKYTGANQGGLYLLNDEDNQEKYLELVACYAYDRRKFQTKKILPGQGLVGQCYKEADKIVLKEIPQNYLAITSGLGDAPPTFLVLVPLKQESGVAGVIELAFFSEQEDYKIDFLCKIGENIAGFVSTNLLNRKTKSLLEQSQQQAEELRAQEEEMRQNMEEMQATQEEMQRKEKEYLTRIEDMESVRTTSTDN